ncbi:hypothetical protein AAFF_G00178640 [Aldrovandia affinis]|uniref:Uncharacterized protein n=1 Tax=Aldrovandia affinis TaxID=143900 RepID=A0AAD7W6S7_9TELE|nr:hypothetical protein AAFF_G00178640 [Aldrovandia affinis]
MEDGNQGNICAASAAECRAFGSLGIPLGRKTTQGQTTLGQSFGVRLPHCTEQLHWETLRPQRGDREDDDDNAYRDRSLTRSRPLLQPSRSRLRLI